MPFYSWGGVSMDLVDPYSRLLLFFIELLPTVLDDLGDALFLRNVDA